MLALLLLLLLAQAASAATPSSTASSPSATTITLGDSVTDSATVTGSLLSPTGTVSFSVCGPLASASGCSTGGNTVASSVPLTPNLLPPATSSADSPGFTPTAAGVWCFRADYSGDATYDPSSDGSSAECVTVSQGASSASSSPQGSAISLGDGNSDSVTVTGNAAGGSPTGSVSFFICGPLASASGCATGGQSIGSAVTLTAAAGNTSTAGSPSFTATSPGSWCFRAEYSGDGNYTGSSDGSSGECFTVGQASSGTSSAPQSSSISLGAGNVDSATVTGNATGGSPTGSVSFFVCGPLASASGCATGGQSIGGAVTLSAAAGNTATASSPSFTPSAPGTWCFRAAYAGDTNYAGSSDGSSGECFTVGAASSSTTSVPHDSSIALGAGNTDSATVTGNATGGSPTGSVSFFVCGPLASATGCSTGGQAVGSAVTLTAAAGNTATASSPSFTPGSTGTWCFRAVYAGDTNYSGSSDGSSGECFTVGKASAGIGSSPQTGSIALGAQDADSATVTGNATGGSPTGSVSFFACGPLASASGCATGGQAVGSAVPLTAASGSTATASSPSFTPGAPGTWCFRAVYSGDGSYSGSSDTSSAECFTVTKAAAPTVSAPQSGSVALGAPNADSATVSGNATGGSPTGTVSFFVCGPLTSASGCSTGGQAIGGAVSLTAGAVNTASASSPSFTATAPGTWCFRAVYSGDGDYSGSNDGSASECFSVGAASSSTTSSPHVGSLVLGSGNTDSATVTGNATGGSPTGSVSFFVCGPLVSASGCTTGGQALGSAVTLTAGSGNTATASSPSFTPGSTGTWCFRAVYSGDSSYGGSSDGTSAECFTVTAASTTTTSSPHDSNLILGGQTTDAATVSGNAAGGSPTGTVSFFVCGPLSSAAGCATGGQAVGSAVSVTGTAGNAATASSPGFTPTAAGTWCFRAVYSGNGNYAGSSDGSAGECFTVGQAAATVTSVPSAQTTNLALGEQDQVAVTGNPAGGSPTGSVSFFVCGPFASAAGCAGGGQAVGAAVTLTAGAGDTATATSPHFTPSSAGIYCFRAAYSGDGNYNASSDGSAGECFTVVQPGAPAATISSPSGNTFYAVGQVVHASYSCTEASGGPGISSCIGSVANGAPIDTSTAGLHTFSVAAHSLDGLTTTVFVGYVVAAAPSVSISSPSNGARYTIGEAVGPSYSCADNQYGPGLATCSAPFTVDTSRPGTFAFTVTAVSRDGQTSTQTVHYTVVAPSNQFTVSQLRGHRDGRVTFRVTVPGGGNVSILETAPRRALLKPKRGRLTFARLTLNPQSAGTLSVDVPPNARGRYLVHHHRITVRVQLTVTFTPINGTPATHVAGGLRVSR